MSSESTSRDGFYVRSGLCLGCCNTHAEAPDLLEQCTAADNQRRCHFKSQPHSDAQLLRAIKATHVSCSRAVRYGGADPTVLEQLTSYGLADQCDALKGAGASQSQHI
jgi:hypothetical protein